MQICPAARTSGLIGALVLSGLFLSCGARSGPLLTQITVTPANQLIAKGVILKLTAMGTFDDKTVHALTDPVTWQTSQPDVATISSEGEVTGVLEGVVTVSAIYQGVTGSTSVTIGPPELISITVSPTQSSLPVGESEQLTATGKFSDGTVQNLTQSATWSSSASAIATVSFAGAALASNVGTATISATSGSVTGSATLTVAPPVVIALNILPSTLSIAMGDSRQLQAMVTLSSGTTQAISSATWQTSQSAVATVNAQGNVTGMGQGVAQVSAAYQGMTASSTVTVGPPALVSISVAPSQSSLPVGESVQLVATGNFSNGTVQTLTQSATWISSGSAIASVSAAGNVVANTTGAVTISATSGSVTGSANVTVSPPVITALNIIPATLSIVLGGSSQLQATATLSNGTTQNVTGTAAWSALEPAIASVSSAGLVSALQIGPATILAQSNGLTASASITVIPLMGVSYFTRIASQNSGMDGTVQLINAGLTAGTLCAMVYVFDQNQELNECCGCSISDDGIRTLSLLNDLTGNTLTGKKPRAGSIQIVSSDPGPNPQCNPSSLAPLGEIVGTETNVQSVGGGNYQPTEIQFDMVPMNSTQETILATECGFLQQLGSGQGTCTCGTGDQ